MFQLQNYVNKSHPSEKNMIENKPGMLAALSGIGMEIIRLVVLPCAMLSIILFVLLMRAGIL